MMNTKILIIEDEIPAREHLTRLLKGIQPNIEILDRLDSVQAAVAWLSQYQADLLFLDIHLSDGNSFSIFEKIAVHTPIIFTTAYDEYAIKAFKVNSIDYLLKPIDEDDLRQSLEKYRKLAVETPGVNLEALIKTLAQPPKTYQERFIVQRGERLMSVLTDQIAYFEGEDRYVYLVKKDGARYIVQYRLSDLETLLDPKQFFRLNRSFIAHFDAISAMINLSKSRIKVELTPKAKREVIVSSEYSQGLKKWLNQ